MTYTRLSSSCACGIDVHAHVVPENFPAYLGSAAPADWPSMAPAHACHRSVMIAGKNYRAVVDKCWDTARRLEDLVGLGAVPPLDAIAAAVPGEAAREFMMFGNARRFLGLAQKEAA